MEAKQQKARKKAQALDGIALLVEAAKYLWALLANAVTCYVFEKYFIFVIIILIIPYQWVGQKQLGFRL